MSKIVFSTCLMLLFCFPFFAQKIQKRAANPTPEQIKFLEQKEDTLAILAYAVLNEPNEADRFAACRQLIKNLVAALKIENSFNYSFKKINSISILAPPDSSFRIFTWQLFVHDSSYRYFGAIQMNQPDLRLFSLSDRSDEMDMPIYESLSPERWYGALYYNIKEFGSKGDKKYLLFGFDAFEFFEKRKLIEVLSFAPDGKPVFGAPVFDRQPDPSAPSLRSTLPEQRIILQYASEVAVRCNWDEQYQKVLYDHLIPQNSAYGRGVTFVPDGSYEGFELKKNHRWQHISKVFNDVNAEVPRPAPVLDQKGNKNIFGRDKNKSGWR